MRCFYHGDIEAVALCKACSHAICHDCCADVGKSAACRNRCEADVLALDDLVERGKTAYQKTSGAYARGAWFFLVIGLLFGGVGLLGFRGEGEVALFPLAFGVVLLLYGCSQFYTARRFRAK